MGTNFYWRVEVAPLPTGAVIDHMISLRVLGGFDNPITHIGKRSAAGAYCWDCRQTLCAGGEAAVHSGSGHFREACPKCGKSPRKVSLTDGGAASVELGFTKPSTEPPTGVGSTASFSWAQDPETVRRICADRPNDALIVDEYGQKLTGAEFLTMLKCNCAIEFTDSIGEAFS